jgi:UDP-N-acetylglucosamine--N-acetylmuramyl-(pentapeptide) pyrophosphoryl-undecaprenol N-acetylglucosamine transferase
MKILLTGGGTGGHIVPFLSVVEEVRKREPDAKFLFVGPKSDFNESLRAAGIEVREIRAGKIRRYFSLQNFLDFFNLLIGTDEAFFHILAYKPDVIFSKGGFASVPVVLAASYTRTPVLTHESDTVPGLANRLIGRFARKIFISFPKTQDYFPYAKTIVTGNPIRGDILRGDRERARRFFSLREHIPVVLVFGGSQGAQRINETLLEALPLITEKYFVIHVCGAKNFDSIKRRVSEMNMTHRDRYREYPYLHEEMKDAFAICDYVISRAGANSLAEIMALNKPSLIIPLSTAAGNHQYFNAKYFADEEYILMLSEDELNAETLSDKLDELNERKDELVANMTRLDAAPKGKRPEEIIAEELLKVKKTND